MSNNHIESSAVPTPDEIWKILKQVSENQKETERALKASKLETERALKASKLETDQQRRETERQRRETDRQRQETDRALKASHLKTEKLIDKVSLQIQKSDSRFNYRWGKFVEALVNDTLVDLLRKKDIDISQSYCRAVGSYQDPSGRVKKREIDILLANGKEVVAVEVKTTLSYADLKYFLETLKNFKKYFKHYSSKKLYGAMAYLDVSKQDVVSQVEEAGLFVIKATSKGAQIVNSATFKPKQFS